jgi:hypothetical protein
MERRLSRDQPDIAQSLIGWLLRERFRGGRDEGQPARVPGQADIRGLVTSRPSIRRGTAV